MYIITATSTINAFGICILGAGQTRADAILDAYGRERKLAKGHYLQEIDPNDEKWADCDALDQHR